MTAQPAAEGWHVIADSDLLHALRRAHAGESPDLILTELYANAEIERPDQ